MWNPKYENLTQKKTTVAASIWTEEKSERV